MFNRHKNYGPQGRLGVYCGRDPLGSSAPLVGFWEEGVMTFSPWQGRHYESLYVTDCQLLKDTPENMKYWQDAIDGLIPKSDPQPHEVFEDPEDVKKIQPELDPKTYANNTRTTVEPSPTQIGDLGDGVTAHQEARKSTRKERSDKGVKRGPRSGKANVNFNCLNFGIYKGHADKYPALSKPAQQAFLISEREQQAQDLADIVDFDEDEEFDHAEIVFTRASAKQKSYSFVANSCKEKPKRKKKPPDNEMQADDFVGDVPERIALDTSHPHFKFWLQARDKEYLKIRAHDTFSCIDASDIHKDTVVLPSAIIYTRKRSDSKGVGSSFKARWVVLGEQWRMGKSVSKSDSFSPVVSAPAVRALLTQSCKNNNHIRMADISNAFLKAHLSKEDPDVVIRIPNALRNEHSDLQMYARLRKAMYGLNIAPRRWYMEFKSYMVSQGWTELLEDGLFSKILESGETIYVAVYVDDLCISAKSPETTASILKEIFDKYDGTEIMPIKDMCPIHGTYDSFDLLGTELRYARGKWYSITLSKYTEKLAKEFRVSSTGRLTAATVKLDYTTIKNNIEPVTTEVFDVRRCLGKLIWLTTNCRPDISVAVSIIGTCFGKAGNSTGCVEACKKILRFLLLTCNKGLYWHVDHEAHFNSKYFATSSASIAPTSIFSDASFATEPYSLRSRTGTSIYFRGALIAWRTKAQSLNTFSTCESEYVAVNDSLEFASGIPAMEIFGNRDCPIFCDNQSAITVANSDVVARASKHVKLRWMRVSEEANRIRFVGTKDQQADALTKTGVTIYGMKDMNIANVSSHSYFSNLPQAYGFLCLT